MLLIRYHYGVCVTFASQANLFSFILFFCVLLISTKSENKWSMERNLAQTGVRRQRICFDGKIVALVAAGLDCFDVALVNVAFGVASVAAFAVVDESIRSNSLDFL